MRKEKTTNVYTAREIGSFIDRVIKHCQKSKLDVQEGMNQRYPQLDNELLIHHVINAYAATEDADEKSRLCEQLQRLIELGADPNKWDREDCVPILHRAIKLHSSSLVRIIVNSPIIDFGKKQHEGYRTAAQVCIKHWPKNIELIQILSTNNNDECQQLFLEAVNYDDRESIRFYIINRLIDFNQSDSEGRLPLHLLCLMGDVDLFNFVLKALGKAGIKVDFNTADQHGNSALHYACHPWGNPRISIIRWLLKNELDPNLPNQFGDYPLHQVVELPSSGFVNLLLEHGAKPELRDSLARTALDKVLTRPELQTDSETLRLLMLAEGGAPPILLPSSMDPIQLRYQQGFWIRGIGAYGRFIGDAVERESNILSKRELMSDDDLDGHHPKVDVDKNPHYSFSPATFVKAGLPIGLFDDDKFGLIIETPRVIPAWCSGLKGEVKTDGHSDVDFQAATLEFRYDKKHQVTQSSSAEIAHMLFRLFKEYISSGYSGLDKYDMCVSPSGLPYNEGLLRYRKEHIKGLVVCQTPKSAYYAMKFCGLCKLEDVSFYEYNPAGEISSLATERVISLADQYRLKDDPQYSLLRSFGVVAENSSRRKSKAKSEAGSEIPPKHDSKGDRLGL